VSIEEKPLPPTLKGRNDAGGLKNRRKMLCRQGVEFSSLVDHTLDNRPERLSGNIENYVGTVKVPVGMMGPLRIIGTAANGDFYAPIATTEGALVASLNRGAFAISRSGGAYSVCLTESVARAPAFQFRSITDAGTFAARAIHLLEESANIVAEGSRHCRLIDMKTSLLGKEVYLIFEFSTGDAAGQNMVTKATQHVCEFLVARAAPPPIRWYVDGNLSGDKKATMLAFTYARGRKVVAECTLKRRMVTRVLKTTPEDMVRYWQISLLGGVQSGSIGAQGHFANSLAGLFVACGQDIACVAEAAVGITRMDSVDGPCEGGADLYASVSLPNLTVGTVGGGTRLPTQQDCLGMIGCTAEGSGRKFAEICGAVALAGEVSIIGSMAAGDFSAAHAKYGRPAKNASMSE